MKQPLYSAIVLGDSTNNTLSIVRSLGEAKIEQTLILKCDEDICLVAKSRYLKNSRVYRISTIEDCMPILEQLKENTTKQQTIICSFDEAAVFIDKKEGISLEDCEKVNNAITDILDEKNYIKDQYFLEISSPGIERILRKEKHLEDNIGQKVCVNLFKPIEKEKQLIGTLQKFDKDSLYISCKDSEGTIKIERKNISLIKTVYEWD